MYRVYIGLLQFNNCPITQLFLKVCKKCDRWLPNSLPSNDKQSRYICLACKIKGLHSQHEQEREIERRNDDMIMFKLLRECILWHCERIIHGIFTAYKDTVPAGAWGIAKSSFHMMVIISKWTRPNLFQLVHEKRLGYSAVRMVMFSTLSVNWWNKHNY